MRSTDYHLGGEGPNNSPPPIRCSPLDLAILFSDTFNLSGHASHGYRLIEPVTTLPGEFADGIHREFDTQAYRLIAERARRSPTRVEVFEIAAGSSMPGIGNRNFGSPWLSRRAAGEISNVEVTVSDLQTHGSLFCRCNNGTLLRLRNINMTPFDLDSEPAPPKATLTLPRLSEESTRELLAKSQGDIARFFETQLKLGATFYLMRNLEPGIEGIFGIAHCKNGVDALQLPLSLGAKRYDVVIARHMQPRFMNQRTALADSVSSILKPNGIGLVGIDRGNRDGSDLFMITPSGNIRRVHSLGGALGWRSLSFSFMRALAATEQAPLPVQDR